jgi:hypothetical protein
VTVSICVVAACAERAIGGRVARDGLGQHLPVARTAPVALDLVRAALVVQRHLDAVPICRPARRGWDVAWGYGAEFVDAEDSRLGRETAAPCSARRCGSLWDKVCDLAGGSQPSPPPPYACVPENALHLDTWLRATQCRAPNGRRQRIVGPCGCRRQVGCCQLAGQLIGWLSSRGNLANARIVLRST